MQATIEKLENGVKYQGTLVFSAEEVKVSYDASLRTAMKKAHIDGFRKGHVPQALVVKHYGDHIQSNAIEDLLQKNMVIALKEQFFDKNITVIGYPMITDESEFAADKEFTVTFTIECYPEINLDGIENIEVKQAKCEIAESDIDKMIENLRDQQAKWQVVDDLAVADNTLANIDFYGKKEGVAFDGGEAKNFDLNVNETRMIPGFTEAIKGHKAGEEFTIEVTFPDDYTAEELKGQKATFDIKIHTVSQKILPEVNEDFVKLFKMDCSVEDFRKNLGKQLEVQSHNLVASYNHAQAFHALTKSDIKAELPETLVAMHEDKIFKRATDQYAQYGLKVETMNDELKNKIQAQCHDEAVVQTRMEVIFNAIEEKFHIREDNEATDEEIKALCDLYSSSYEQSSDFADFIEKNPQAKKELVSEIESDKLHKKLVALLKVEEQTVSFDELVKMTQQQ